MNTATRSLDAYELRIAQIHRELGIPRDYHRRGLPLQREAEPSGLVEAPLGRGGEKVVLGAHTVARWRELYAAARSEGVKLYISSGFRSVADQVSYIRRNLAAGDSIEGLLQQFAAPGYSEHHTGRAVDISIDDCAGFPFAENYERTRSFRWLAENAGRFGFTMTFPRGNRYGLMYEPWHWTSDNVSE